MKGLILAGGSSYGQILRFSSIIGGARTSAFRFHFRQFVKFYIA